MSRDEILAVLMEALAELQTRSGLERPDLVPESKPLELEEFDSLKCVELEVLLSERLECEVKNVVISQDEPDSNLSLSEVADEILAQMVAKEPADA